jgi:Smg protein
MFEVLVYLYENSALLSGRQDADSISRQLADAGFEDDEISEAFGWLRDLEQVSHDQRWLRPAGESSFRVLAASERDRLSPAAVSFLAFLEGADQLTPAQRELVIERALAIGEAPVSLARLKVIVLMVLWSQQADIDVLLLEELLDDGEDRLSLH